MINYSNVQILAQSDDARERINLLLTTRVGTVVLDRNFGIDMSFIDKPTPQAVQMYTIEVIDKIQKYEGENGIRVKSVTFDLDKSDITKLTPTVILSEE